MGAFSREYSVNYGNASMTKAIDELVDSIMGLGQGDIRTYISRIIINSLNPMFAMGTSTEEEKHFLL